MRDGLWTADHLPGTTPPARPTAVSAAAAAAAAVAADRRDATTEHGRRRQRNVSKLSRRRRRQALSPNVTRRRQPPTATAAAAATASYQRTAWIAQFCFFKSLVIWCGGRFLAKRAQNVVFSSPQRRTDPVRLLLWSAVVVVVVADRN